jgi:hypothetical protein
MPSEVVLFHPGETVYPRHFQRDAISAMSVTRVVRHDAAGLLVWSGAGERFWLWDMPDGRTMRDTPLAEWTATAGKVCTPRRAWHGTLAWHPTGADYSIRLLFAPDGEFTGWYANLELAAVGWRDGELAGLDTVDWDLDIVIEADRSWRWKDEEEFAQRLRSPEHYWVSDEARVRRAGREVVELVEAGASPFDGSWQDFRPDPAWTTHDADRPPNGWDRPRAC